MSAWIRKLFAPPVFEDEHKARVARLLNTVLLIVLGATIIGTAITAPLEPDEAMENLTFGFILVVVMLVLRFLVYRGYTRIVGLLLSSVLWMSFTYLILSGDRILDPSLSGYFLVIALAIVLVGDRSALIFSLISILTTAGILYVELNGIIDPITPRPASVLDLITLITTMGLTSLLLRFAVHGMNEGLKRALENELAQIEANRELQAIRASLEQRVEQRTHDLEKRSAQLQAAVKIGRTAALIRELDQLLTQVPNLISENFDFYHVGMFLLDETNRYAELRASSSVGGATMMAEGYRIAVGEQGILGHVTGVREPRIALDVGEAAVQFEYPHLTLTRSEMVLPLIASNRLLGALDLHSVEQAAFDQDDIAMFQVLADQLAAAIENAYLLAESQAALEAERLAYGEASSQAWAQLIGAQADLGYISDAQRVHPTRGHWQPEMIQASQEEQLVQDGEATVAIPIKIREQTAGVVRLRKPDGASAWTTDEIELMENLTRQLGLTLESARHYRDTQQRALRERMTTEITAHIRETLDMDTVLQTAIREIGDKLNIAQVQVRMKGQGE